MSENAVAGHYGRASLFDEIAAALAAEGIDIDSATVEELAALDHFHGRGLAATEELADALAVEPDHHLLDIGCGIGGPARYMAKRFGCRVTGIDLTPEFCEVARRLTRITRLDDRVEIRQGSATGLPFPDAGFDGAYSQNVSMNIADRARQHAEAFRVIRPGGFLALHEAVLGTPGAEVIYPVPWSSDGSGSHLETAEATVASLETAGFEVVSCIDGTESARRAYEAQRETIAREGPPRLGAHVIMGAGYREKQRNAALNVMEGRVVPVEILCRKPV